MLHCGARHDDDEQSGSKPTEQRHVTYRIIVRPATVGALWVDHLHERLQCTPDVVRVLMQLVHGTTPTAIVGYTSQQATTLSLPSIYQSNPGHQVPCTLDNVGGHDFVLSNIKYECNKPFYCLFTF